MQEVYTHIFETDDPRDFTERYEAMEFLNDYGTIGYKFTFYNDGSDNAYKLDMSKDLEEFRKEKESEYRHYKFLKSLEATNRI